MKFDVCYTDESESKDFLVETLYRRSVPWTRNNQKASSSKNQNAFTKNIHTKKDAKNETEYEKYLVTDEVPSYFDIF